MSTISPNCCVRTMLLSGAGRTALSFAVGYLAFAGAAHAQEAASANASADEIVVTGTLIRGIAPGGTQTIGIDQEQIAAVGAANTSQLLAAVPQAGTFMGVPAVQGNANTRVTVNRPTLRYLGNTSGGTASTLVLVDGHRLPGMGVRQTSPDVDAIAAGAIERVEVITDGGSSTYGSDAVGGVINFVTRKKFDGLEAKGSYGFADDYQTWDASVTAGKTWDWGSLWASYNFVKHDDIFGADRDYVQRVDWANSQLTGTRVLQDLQCAPGNVSTGSSILALPGLTAGLGNRCDLSDYRTIYPKEERHSVFAGLTVDTGGPISFSVKGFYAHRVNQSDAGPLGTSVTFRSGANAGRTVLFNLSPVLGNSVPQRSTLESWGFTPTVKADLGGDWQANILLNAGGSTAQFKGGSVNPVTLPTGLALGTFDPLNLTSASSAAAIRTAADYFDFGRSRQHMTNMRAVIDGPLFALPGGDIRVAIGAEYMAESFKSRILVAPQATIDAAPWAKASRNVKSVFGEINVPVIGEGNRGFLYAASINASVRHDDYSDFGGTTNPKIGIDIAPVEWLKLRGNWGKSFQAPSLSETPQVNPSTLTNLQSVRFANPFPPFNTVNTTGKTQVFLGGIIPGLKPMTAKTWSFGFDLQPPVIPGLSLGATYYHIDFKDQIGVVPVFNPTVFYSLFPDLYSMNPTQAQVNALAAQATNPTALTTVPLSTLYNIADGRTRNLARIITSGIDFNLRYRTDTDFGAVFLSTNGNYILHFKNQPRAGVALSELVDTTSRFRISSSLGAEVGNLKGQVTWNHAGGFSIAPTAANLQQSKVEHYDLFNLYFQYDVPGEGVFKDLSFTVNVDNVFDKDPPLLRGTQDNNDGFANGFTLGRLVKFGVSKKF